MSTPWDDNENYPDPVPIKLTGWLRVVLRGPVLVLVVFGGLGLLLLVRLFERPIFGQGRPVTPFITQFVCRMAFLVLGIRYRTTGKPMRGQGAVVANHGSWLDIFTLNARKRIYFVSKAEVAGWPGIGWLARATGTLFVRRERNAAAAQIEEFHQRLDLGHKLLFFPEGTSSDTLRVLPFKSTLFAAFLKPELVQEMIIQPVSVNYTAPLGQDKRFYGWWGDMELAPHLLQILAAYPQGSAEVIYHSPVKAADFSDRKVLAAYCETQVRAGLAASEHN
ncbi:MAG: 1-acyl-sn-glycerol-3-phosphate acyltransferase [Rhodobacteraceae bacterium]|nr:1-acyl-sn-glycerol-3-phosphate acyltransferase [Paracoccaceae bacterium]